MMQTQKFNRRQMLQWSAAGVAALGLSRCGLAMADEKPKLPGIALQLYSIRNDCAADFDKALEWVAEQGFEAVEFAGYHKYGGNPAGLKSRLDDLGLKVAATHIGTGSFIGDALKGTIEFHKAIGCKYLIVPGDGRFSNPNGNRELAEIFNKAAEQLKPEGMYCGYHNHTHEFQKDGDKTYWELFAERTSDDVVLQQDIGWTWEARQDPVALIRKYPGRSKVVHFKPTVRHGEAGRPIIGEDTVPWSEVITACVEAGGTEWITIEQEAYLPGKTPMECAAMSLAGLKKLYADWLAAI